MYDGPPDLHPCPRGASHELIKSQGPCKFTGSWAAKDFDVERTTPQKPNHMV